jgi:hypothetical protein
MRKRKLVFTVRWSVAEFGKSLRLVRISASPISRWGNLISLDLSGERFTRGAAHKLTKRLTGAGEA